MQESCPLFLLPAHMKAAERTEKSETIMPSRQRMCFRMADLTATALHKQRALLKPLTNQLPVFRA